MPVEMIIDQWNPSQKRYRFETFCYGPKSCSLYRPGATRKVPGRKGMSYTEEDWIDETLPHTVSRMIKKTGEWNSRQTRHMTSAIRSGLWDKKPVSDPV